MGQDEKRYLKVDNGKDKIDKKETRKVETGKEETRKLKTGNGKEKD